MNRKTNIRILISTFLAIIAFILISHSTSKHAGREACRDEDKNSGKQSEFLVLKSIVQLFIERQD